MADLGDLRDYVRAERARKAQEAMAADAAEVALREREVIQRRRDQELSALWAIPAEALRRDCERVVNACKRHRLPKDAVIGWCLRRRMGWFLLVFSGQATYLPGLHSASDGSGSTWS